MNNKTKEAERAELHKTIWRIANDLRGSVDGWDFKKSSVPGMLSCRFISGNLCAYLDRHEHRAGHADFDYSALSDASAEFERGGNKNKLTEANRQKIQSPRPKH